MCAFKTSQPGNLGCLCVGQVLVCGSSRRFRVQKLLRWCYNSCQCGSSTKVDKRESTRNLDKDPRWGELLSKPRAPGPNPYTRPSGNNPTGSSHTCSGTCTSVDRGCNYTSNGDCKCFAPPVSLFYWHEGDCGTRPPLKAKRDLALHRHSYYLNATAQFAPSDKVTAPAGPLPDHAAQLASGLLPSPCNASYVSFACSDSPDGIVHEPPQNWLGALVPEGAKELPPVPKEFLRIHGGREEKMQVLRPTMDERGLGLE
ncbi:hypothetical protein MMC22_008797 [Lobaria immixta]|nr:hypothetical protein [Lobaria immixta]